MVGSWFAVLDGGGSLETGGMSAEDPPRAGAWERRKVPQGEPKRPLLFMLSLSPRPGHWLRGAGEGCGRGGPPQDPAWRDRSPQAGRKCGGAAPHPAARLSEGRPCPRRRGHAPGSAPGTPGSASEGYRNPEPALLAAAHGPSAHPRGGGRPATPVGCALLLSQGPAQGQCGTQLLLHPLLPGAVLQAGPCLSLGPGCGRQNNRGSRNEEGLASPPAAPASPGGTFTQEEAVPGRVLF